jgi:SAM-dependent methyltransferase
MIWDERYSEEGFAYGTEPNDFLAQQVESLPRGRVLCLAEGEGRNAVYLASLGFDVVAVDGSRVGMQKAQTLANERGVQFEAIVADLADFYIEPSSFDLVVSIWCHVPPALRRELHRRVVFGLRRGGTLLLEAYTPHQLDFKTGGPPTADLMMSLTGLRNELSELEFIIGRECEREVHEGKYHDGLSHVVQLLARKPELKR